MLITKTNPVGVDKKIYQFQRKLYTGIKNAWSLTDEAKGYQSYPRVYRNQSTDGGYVAEVSVDGKDYKDAFVDDKFKVISFFGLGENIKYDSGSYIAPVFIIFMLNLKSLYPGNTRSDEEARRVIIQLADKKDFEFQLQNVVLGMDNIFREYPGTRVSDGLKYRDMQPWHCFRLNFSVHYNNNC